MLSYDRLKKNPRAFRTFTGLDQSEFETLLPAFECAWNDYIYNTRIKKKKRKRRHGAGRKARLRTIEDKLLFILVYYKIYPIQEVMAFMFDMSQSRVNEWTHRLTDVLHHALGKQCYLPERDPQNLEHVLALCVSVDFIIDGTERRIQRAKDNEQQKEQCSGKKKTHTIKNNLIIDIEDRLVRYLSNTHAGSHHDKRICDDEDLTFPPDIVLFKDTGFQGYEPDNIVTHQPKKKPKGKELSPEDKAENALISSIRIIVEHVIGGVKRCHIVHDVFRNTKARFADRVMEIACGLHNLRATLRYAPSG